jgi:hypothetical protein
MKKYALSLTSGFNTASLLKARILMLYKRPSTKVAFAKYGFMLPLLAFCMLVTAFTQRERILPTTLAEELTKVAQNFQQEVQKAFMPSSSPTTLENYPIVEVKKKNIELDAQTLPTNTFTLVGKLPTRDMMTHEVSQTMREFPSISTPLESIKKDKKSKYHNNVIPFHFRGYNLFMRKELKGRKENLNIVSKKETPYFIMFYDKETHKKVDYDIVVKVTQEDQEVQVMKTAKGYEFVSQEEKVTRIFLENLPKDKKWYAVVYERSRRKPVDASGFSIDTIAPLPTPHIELKDAQGNTIDAFSHKKIDTKQQFQFVFTKNQGFTDLVIEEILVVVKDKEKNVIAEKVFQGSSFDLRLVPVKKGELIHIRITRSSGKFKDKVIQNPTIFGGNRIVGGRFILTPKIK